MKKRAVMDINTSIMQFPPMTSQSPGWTEVSFQQDEIGRKMMGSYSIGLLISKDAIFGSQNTLLLTS